MTLNYLRQDTMGGMDSDTAPSPASKRSGWKFSKGKFSFLVGGNLIVWIIFIVSFSIIASYK